MSEITIGYELALNRSIASFVDEAASTVYPSSSRQVTIVVRTPGSSSTTNKRGCGIYLDSTMLFTFCVDNTKVKQEPRPGLLVTSMEPPCCLTICSTIDSPIPVPTSPDCSAF